MSLETLVKFSNRYGKTDGFVLAGGGNTSAKEGEYLFVKGSGTSLATITADGFVRMDRAKLDAIWQKTYSADTAARESEILADLMASRADCNSKRPSVETLLHNLFPQKYVLHVHPTKVNGLTCSKSGKEVAGALFPNAVWVDECEPGYILASRCRTALTNAKMKTGKDADVVILQNHGIFFAADDEKSLDALVDGFMAKLDEQLKAQPDFTSVERYDAETAATIAPVLRLLYNENGTAYVHFTANKEIMKYAESAEAFSVLKHPLSPDHIVYCKAEPLFLEDFSVDGIKAAFTELKERRGFAPKIVFAKGVGMFALGANVKEAKIAADVWADAMAVSDYAANFGGVRHMAKELEEFIVNWEVESYRSKVSLSANADKPLSGKIALVTGSAQGFGEGIARNLAAAGASVVIADMNAAGAQKTADAIAEEYGVPTIAIAGNVTDEESVKAMFRDTVLSLGGGLDIFVNNAGIVRSGSLEEMTKSNFELVASVNYTAYFLCTKYASAVMKLQRAAAPEYMADIIEINSKSGLAGSNKNFAYAGSKFGGIGLTQSFAMELAPYGIKVNAVCPGNFLDGPLWSDPEKGLFVQYLKAGKVPGATCVEDVRKFYTSKVPLGRGCRIEDVAKAVLYIIDQKYETGQAVPVTGGQEMLK